MLSDRHDGHAALYIFAQAPRLSPEPCLRIQLSRSASQLKLQDVVLAYHTKCLTGTDMLTAVYVYGAQVAVNRNIAAVAHHYDHAAAETEHGTNLAVEYRTG